MTGLAPIASEAHVNLWDSKDHQLYHRSRIPLREDAFVFLLLTFIYTEQISEFPVFFAVQCSK